MPTKERYAKDKAYYQKYHRSETYKHVVKPKMKSHLKALHKCPRCHHDIPEGSATGDYCINCIELAVQRRELSRSFF